MYADVVNLLEWLGYAVTEEDTSYIEYLIEETTAYAKASCNITEIPPQLTYKLTERVVGLFLYHKRATGQLTGENFNFEAVPKSIKEGDTQVTFAYGEGSVTPEQKFSRMIDFLMNNLERHLALFRCIKW